MKTNIDVFASAITYFLLGLGLFFAPDKLLQAAAQEPTAYLLWSTQLLGAALLGLSWMNYLNKSAPIGGIYGRPLLLQNLMFAFPSFIFSFKSWQSHSEQTVFLFAAVIFGLIAAAFTLRFFGKGPASTAN